MILFTASDTIRENGVKNHAMYRRVRLRPSCSHDKYHHDCCSEAKAFIKGVGKCQDCQVLPRSVTFFFSRFSVLTCPLISAISHKVGLLI